MKISVKEQWIIPKTASKLMTQLVQNLWTRVVYPFLWPDDLERLICYTASTVPGKTGLIIYIPIPKTVDMKKTYTTKKKKKDPTSNNQLHQLINCPAIIAIDSVKSYDLLRGLFRKVYLPLSLAGVVIHQINIQEDEPCPEIIGAVRRSL